VTRGQVCRLQLQLVLASAVILGSVFHETHDHILLSQIRDSPNLEGQVPVFISLRNRAAEFMCIIYKNLVCTSQETYYGTLQRPTGQCSLGKESLFIVRTIRNTQTQSVGRLQSSGILKRVLHIVTCYRNYRRVLD
jgi:hypothetical protein